MSKKKTERGLGSKGLRAYSPEAEAKYIGLRGVFSSKFYLNEVLDQMLFMALQKEYRNESLLIFFLLYFVYLRSNDNLENMLNM